MWLPLPKPEKSLVNQDDVVTLEDKFSLDFVSIREKGKIQLFFLNFLCKKGLSGQKMSKANMFSMGSLPGEAPQCCRPRGPEARGSKGPF